MAVISRSASPTPDLEHGLVDRRARRRRAVDDPGHLEAEHLAAHDAVLDDDLEVGVDEQLGERRAPTARRCDRGRRRLGRDRATSRRPASTVGGDANSAARRATHPAASASSTTSVTSVAPCRSAHTRAGPKRRDRVGVEQQPRRRAVDEGGAAREHGRLGAGRVDEGAQLGGEERRPVSQPAQAACERSSATRTRHLRRLP